MIIETKPCPVCQRTSRMEVDGASYMRWVGGELIQIAFPSMSIDDRELMITGTHPECWKKIFPEEE